MLRRVQDPLESPQQVVCPSFVVTTYGTRRLRVVYRLLQLGVGGVVIVQRRNFISEAQTLLMTTNLPEGRSQRTNELLTAAVHPGTWMRQRGNDLVEKFLGTMYWRTCARPLPPTEWI
jgi:hypothetical protein